VQRYSLERSDFLEVIIQFCSAPCGSGKTYQLIKSACRLANGGETVLLLHPTKELIDKTIADRLLGLSSAPLYEKFYGGSQGHSVAWDLTEYLKTVTDGGHIVFATHQVMPFVRFWANQDRLHIFVDEELQVAKHGCFQIPDTHELITRFLDLDIYNAIYSRVIVNDLTEVAQIAKNPANDQIYEQFRETAQLLTNDHWDSFVNTEQFENLKAGKVKRLSIHSVLNPRVLDGFASVTMASANFRDTLLYKLWSRHGVQFEENKALSQNLRFQEHQNGHLISIRYLTDRPWSRKLHATPCQSSGDSSETRLDTMVRAVQDEFRDNRFLWQANKWIGDHIFGEHGQRLPNVPHGLNDYSEYDRIAFLSALNPRSDHFRFLESRGVDGNDVRRAIYCLAVYQSAMRTSIRDPQSITHKTVIVPDVSAAQYLQEAFPGAQVEKLKTGLIELEAPKRLGRPRKYSSSKDRRRAYRLKRKQSALVPVLQVEKFPYVGQKSCCDEKGRSKMGDENGIGLNTHFDPHLPCHGTLYRDKKSRTPLGYLSGVNTELFLGFLEDLHTRTVESKDESLLISPAIFDPNHPEAEGFTQRGLKNIVAMRHLWMDFENGDLRPEDIAELFPHTQLVAFNTYNHTKEAQRFRVVIPFGQAISPDDYTVLYDNIIAKLEDAGYSVVGKSQGDRRSGLDLSGTKPTSLFYLPCQAQDPSDSFFMDYNDDKSKLLDPMTWIGNSVVQFRKVDDVRSNAQQTPPEKVDQAAVEKATMIWRESPRYPGEGNARFFNFALALRSAGMGDRDIQLKLRDEAKSGRSPRDRAAQIPSIMTTLRRPIRKSA